MNTMIAVMLVVLLGNDPIPTVGLIREFQTMDECEKISLQMNTKYEGKEDAPKFGCMQIVRKGVVVKEA
jgi:hypothetical protein